MSFEVHTRDKATYAVPGGILPISKHRTILLKVWPCALHIIVAYAGTKG